MTPRGGGARARAGSCIRAGLALSALAVACSRPHEVPAYDERERFPGGGTTTSLGPFPDFERPVANLPARARSDFFAGKALAEQPWVKAPTTTTARDGLGPLYNARTCFECHRKGGRGAVPDDERASLTRGVLRLSIPGRSEHEGAVPEPTYGLQLQTQATSLRHQLRHRIENAAALGGLAPEGQVFVRWEEQFFEYPDGRRVTLRSPRVNVAELGYGPMHPATQRSLRLAPPMFGAGLIDLVDQSAIDALADPEDEDEDGISGRVNQVWDFQRNQFVPGRFGHKANRATLEITVAGAFADDLGINNALFPGQPCTAAQEACRKEPNGVDDDGLEISRSLLTLVVDFNRNLGVPERRGTDDAAVSLGRGVFFQVGCASCHQPRFETGHDPAHPHLSHQVIWPYGDFLLHDMGEALADHRSDYEASGSEWRTAPLWGLGLAAIVNGSEGYLHDGRARSLEEAILWHGGEAASARRRFTELSQPERERLLAFVGSL